MAHRVSSEAPDHTRRNLQPYKRDEKDNSVEFINQYRVDISRVELTKCLPNITTVRCRRTLY
ncbi:unnamed protein product [Acanthoscelides obtectus]|uniref:Uncharacterized protein n=1 Tax=Acanthoscelides obtectus TaxID=200917 RepID=A0A9P0K0V3_ACAOB|nr:unnamed protein product [Acanthoscelides obtectus]CAK1628823.1 hypothetical protein AOBTE_LOCUS5419 [Acanthoscelides obtectus]